MYEWSADGKEFKIKELEGDAEFRAAEEIQREAWGFADLDIVPAAHLVAVQSAGGILLGAFDGDRMIGFVYGFPGYEHGHISIHSHMLAVKPEYRSMRAGVFLKLAQREQALRKGIDEITWTFDPLQALNASLNFSRLGVISNRYIIDFYGEASSSPLHQGFGTDRLWVSWLLNSDHVRRRVAYTAAGKPRESAPADLLSRLPMLVRSEDQAITTADLEQATSGDKCLIEIPENINEVKELDPSLGKNWRRATRRAFMAALANGFVVQDFLNFNLSGRRIWAYLLGRDFNLV
jgi:predicted GNAT superfamily acetyltransferase